MSVRDALYRLVHDYPGGASTLAVRMDLAASTLRCMASLTIDSHDWSLKRFEQAMAFTGDLRPLHALCAEFGGVFVPVSSAAHGDDALMQTLATAGKEFGDVCATLSTALADQRITHRELAEFEQQVYELVQVAQNLRLQVRERAEAQPLFKAVP